jgi:hypothetical protein
MYIICNLINPKNKFFYKNLSSKYTLKNFYNINQSETLIVEVI